MLKKKKKKHMSDIKQEHSSYVLDSGWNAERKKLMWSNTASRSMEKIIYWAQSHDMSGSLLVRIACMVFQWAKACIIYRISCRM